MRSPAYFPPEIFPLSPHESGGSRVAFAAVSPRVQVTFEVRIENAGIRNPTLPSEDSCYPYVVHPHNVLSCLFVCLLLFSPVCDQFNL